MPKYLANTILHDGKEGFKLAGIEIPPICVALIDNQKTYTLAYLINKGSKPSKAEYDSKDHNAISLNYNNLLNYEGVVIPESGNVPSSWYNGRNLSIVDGIFTRDKRIFLSENYDEKNLEEVIKRVISIFTLNRWQNLFEAHVTPKEIL